MGTCQTNSTVAPDQPSSSIQQTQQPISSKPSPVSSNPFYDFNSQTTNDNILGKY